MILSDLFTSNDTLAEGEVVAFPKKHKSDLSTVHSCPKCGGDLQGGKYMGHEVKVCMPCKQVYLPPNSGIDQKGDKITEFVQSGGNDGGNYLQALASAWLNGTFNTGDLHKGIKSQEDVERVLARGIHCGDGKVRKYSIGYNSDFDGVEIQSDAHYEYSDYDDAGNDIDSRTGQPWGPYDVVAFSGDDLDESVNEMDKGSPQPGRDGRVSHSTYGSRDKHVINGPEGTGRPLTAKQMMDRAHKAMLKSMSKDEKVDKGWRNPNVDEGKPKEKEADYGDEYQAMVSRVKKLAGLGPLKTQYDPQKRVYKNVPTAVQPKKV